MLSIGKLNQTSAIGRRAVQWLQVFDVLFLDGEPVSTSPGTVPGLRYSSETSVSVSGRTAALTTTSEVPDVARTS